MINEVMRKLCFIPKKAFDALIAPIAQLNL
jgi:hypothetical protein